MGILILLGVVVATGYLGGNLYERHERHTKRGRVDPNLVKELTRLEQEKQKRADP